MLELLFLLLPIAAGYGWVMGKNSAKNQAHQQNRHITAEYSKGLKYLLDREEDQGLETLISLLEVSADSVEHYLTLASLFRRRGEIDRAIKVHELLLKHPNLDDAQRRLSQRELATDYISAGLLDSAEQQLVELIEARDTLAVEPLLNVYQQTREWEKGVALYDSHTALFDSKQKRITLANFCVELGKKQKSQAMLLKAHEIAPESTRAIYEQGALAFAQKEYDTAITVWLTLLKNHLDLAPLLYRDLNNSFEKLGRQQEFAELLAKLSEHTNLYLKFKYAEWLLEQAQHEAAHELVLSSLKRQPNIRGFASLLKILQSQHPGAADVINEINQLVSAYIRSKHEFQCQHCGFESHTLYWSCPSCKHWESLVPHQGLDGF